MSEKSTELETNWDKVDSYVIHPEDYEELPEWTEDMFASADLYENGILIQRGHHVKALEKNIATVCHTMEDVAVSLA
ncbi:MAG: hypothetical protein HQL77_15620 [Magnetococcales bacterium]|nr:hypothetical protein [Magnetococcales bacterium]